MPSGHCATEREVRAGRANSETSPETFHGNCPGVFTSPIGQVLCDCPYHETQDAAGNTSPVVPAVTLAPPVPGRRDRKLVEQAGKILKDGGVISWAIEPDWDEARITNLKSWLWSAAKRNAVHVKVVVEGDHITATVKG